MKNTIQLYSKIKQPTSRTDLSGIVRIDPKAEEILKDLSRKTGLTQRSIVSTIVEQAADLIEIIYT